MVIMLLVIDDDALDRKVLARALKSLGTGYELHEAHDSRAGIELASAWAFDCILLDYNMPGTNGLDTLTQLRAGLNANTPIVMLTGSGNETVAVEAMKLGASDYLPKEQLGPNSILRVVSNAIEKSALRRDLEAAQKKLEQLALYDNLTGIGNRNLFNIELPRAIAVSQRKGTPFSLLMMDLDKFKRANDVFGHQAGDAILAEVGRRLRGSRPDDAYFRLGGDEFTAILAFESDAGAAAQRIRTAIARPIAFGTHTLAIEISIGLAAYPGDAGNARDLVRAADLAMYRDKASRARIIATMEAAAE